MGKGNHSPRGLHLERNSFSESIWVALHVFLPIFSKVEQLLTMLVFMNDAFSKMGTTPKEFVPREAKNLFPEEQIVSVES